MKTQIGESLISDFEENTWTFEMKEDFKATAGSFAIIPVLLLQEFLHSVQGIRNSMNVHPDCTEDSEFEGMVSRIDEITKKIEI